jgi:hypothetical protein
MCVWLVDEKGGGWGTSINTKPKNQKEVSDITLPQQYSVIMGV